MPRVCTSSTRLASLGGDSEADGGGCDGAITCQLSGPTRPVSPYDATRTGTPARAARPCTSRTPEGGSASEVTSIAPDRPAVQRRRPARRRGRRGSGSAPRAGTGRTPSRRRQPSIAAGSGPASTTTAECRPGVQDETVALAHVAGDHAPSRAGGQPGVGSGTSSAHTITDPKASVVARRARTAPANRQPTTQSTVSTAMPSGPEDQPTAATGRSAPLLGDRDDPRGAPGRGQRDPLAERRRTPARRRPPARPSTVAGPTAGATSRLADHRHQRDLARDRRDQRRAGELGRQRHRDRLGHPPRQPARQPVAPARREPEDARRGQRREREPGRDRQPRVDQQQEQHRGPERPRTAPAAVGAHADQGHGAHHRGAQHAGLGPGEQHEPEDPEHTDHEQSPGPDAHPAGQQQQGARPRA